MAGKARVHELAKELGVTSKEVLARLSDQGEFVKSASSTVEAPVARRLRESFGGPKPAADKVKADGNGAPAKKAAAAAKAPAPEKVAAAPAAPPEPPAAPAEPAAPAAAAVGTRTRSAWARPPVPAPAERPPVPSRHRAHRASATIRSPRRSPSTGRFRGRRHPDPVPRGPAAARVPAPRRAICRPVPAVAPPAVQHVPAARGPHPAAAVLAAAPADAPVAAAPGR